MPKLAGRIVSGAQPCRLPVRLLRRWPPARHLDRAAAEPAPSCARACRHGI